MWKNEVLIFNKKEKLELNIYRAIITLGVIMPLPIHDFTGEIKEISYIDFHLLLYQYILYSFWIKEAVILKQVDNRIDYHLSFP